MTIDDKIRDEKLQYDINRDVGKISKLSGKIDKYEYLTDEEILSFNQKEIIEQAKFAYSPISKAFFFRKSFWRASKNNWKTRKNKLKF